MARKTEQADVVDAAIQARVTIEQVQWLRARAQELETSLSGALRMAIDQARLYEAGRAVAHGEDRGFEPADAVFGMTPVDELDQEHDPA